MRKILALLLVLIMVVINATSIAEETQRIITINLETASDEELENAITQLKAEQRARLKTTIQLDISEIKLNKGSTQKVTATVIDVPEGVTAGKITWKSSDETVATCNNGSIRIAGPGEAVITCFSLLSDGTEITADISVTGLLPVQSISLESAKMDVMAGDTFMPNVIIKPDNASNKEVLMTSSDEKIVKINEAGQLVAIMEGRATITITTADGSNKSARMNVNVTKKIGKYDDELTFQGIQWGHDYNVVFNQLKDNGIIAKSNNARHINNTSSMYFWPENDILFAANTGWNSLPVVFDDKDIGAARIAFDPTKKIGGYMPQQSYLCFLNKLTDDGRILKEQTELCGIYFYYDTKHEPGTEIFTNILTKLEAQYGEFTRYISKNITSYSSYKEFYDQIKGVMKGAKQFNHNELGKNISLSNCAICTLRGKNNTGIMLKITYNGNVTLFYGKTDVLQKIQAIQKILEADPDNTEDAGL